MKMWLIFSIIAVFLAILTSSLITWKVETVYGKEELLSSKSNKIVTILLMIILFGYSLGSLVALGASIAYGLLAGWDITLSFVVFFEVVVIIGSPFVLHYMWRKGLFRLS